MEVWVTGVGVLSAAGAGLDALTAALWKNESCGSPWTGELPVDAVARVVSALNEDDGFLDDRKAQLAFGALERAIEDAGLHPHEWPVAERRSVFLGTGLSSVTPEELASDVYPHLGAGGFFDRAAMARDVRPDKSSPWRHLPARVTAEFARRLGAAGPSGTSFSACAAAAQAIAEGVWAIRRGQVDVAVVGGHDSMLHPLGLLSFVMLGALAPGACRPFDRGRAGFMIGEGACVLVLESAEHARRRGAMARARVLGAGTSVDAWNVTAPHPDGVGAELAMRRALRDAGCDPADVDYVNAHGTGTPLGDAAEAAAIGRVFGPNVPMSSVKGAVGHTIAAAGAIEAAVCIAALQRGFLPGTAGLMEPDAGLPVRPLVAPIARQAEVVVSNSFGFGGQNCAVVFGRVEA